MEIAKVNTINQEINIQLEKKTPEHQKFLELLQSFVETESKQKIEGTIENVSIYNNYMGVEIKLKTIKEDRLKLVSFDADKKTFEAAASIVKD